MSNLITLDKLALDDAVFRACEEATVALTTVPLRLRAAFAIQASTNIMAEVDKMAVAVPAAAAKPTHPVRPPRVRARKTPGAIPPPPAAAATTAPAVTEEAGLPPFGAGQEVNA